MARPTAAILITALLITFQGAKLGIVLLLPEGAIQLWSSMGLVHFHNTGWNAGLLALGVPEHPILHFAVGPLLLVGIGTLMVTQRLDTFTRVQLTLLFAASLSHELEGLIRGGVIDYLILDYGVVEGIAFNLEDIVIFSATAALILRVVYILVLAVRYSSEMEAGWSAEDLLRHHRHCVSSASKGIANVDVHKEPG